jgi:uncharacterized protein (TIGR03032 family)
MSRKAARTADATAALWAHHNAQLRDPAEVVAQWQPPTEPDPRLLDYRVRGRFWEALAATRSTLLVTREYEHLLVAFCAAGGTPRVSYLRLPHPSGLAVDSSTGTVHVASTRNPNMIIEFAPCRTLVPRAGRNAGEPQPLLLPLRSRYLPGCLYLHDLALIGGRLHGNAVGLNAIVELPPASGFTPVWWPGCIDAPSGPRFDRNYLQLNSIAAANRIEESYFSASAAEPGRRRPGHLNFPVDRRGVIFSGATRQVWATGLTRPHSVRLFHGRLWVDNSGYGEVGTIRDGHFEPVVRLPGWTRGLCSDGQVGFAGSSRIIPRFRCYAPGVDADRSEAGVHVFDLKTGSILGSLIWPAGNQIFALELISSKKTIGFPFSASRRNAAARVREFFFRGTPT